MRTKRFKVDDVSASIIRVTGQEAEHALRVLRLKADMEVTLFDGRGQEAAGRICKVGRMSLEVQVTRRNETEAGQTQWLDLAVAAPKGRRGDWLVEKCAELGVHSLWLLETKRGEVFPGEGKLTRWRRKSVEAAKQAGHAVTMSIQAPRTIGDVVASGGARWLFYGAPERSRPSFSEALRADSARPIPGDGTMIFIGPEGGFTETERATIEAAGGQPVRLATATLRVETAAVAVASIWGGWTIEAANE